MDTKVLAAHGICFDEGVEKFMGEKELFEGLLRDFLTDNTFEEARSCFEKGDTDGAEKAVHAMKSVTGTLCMHGLYRLCADTVTAVREGRTSDAQELFNKTYDTFRDIAQAIKDSEGGKMKYLVVVDMQKDFIDGSLGTPEAQEIVDRVCGLIKGYRSAGGRIFVTMDTHGEDYLSTQEGRRLPVKHCIKGTPGWRLDERVEQALGGVGEIFEKPCFGSVELAKRIKKLEKGCDEVELCGLCTDICVVSNALLIKAQCPELPVSVRADCCAGVTPAKHEAALETMRSCQVEVR